MKITFEFVVFFIVKASVAALFISIFIDFYLYHAKGNTKQEKHSIVATGSMIAFFIVYYIVLRLKLGCLPPPPYGRYIGIILVGTMSVVLGAIINIAGRIQLKGNWANHIKIYENHNIVTRGVYSHVRHPLYASIIFMLIGGSILYCNWLSLVLVLFVFTPAMFYRAKQEELLLLSEFPTYSEYRQQVGMFFPKSLRGYENGRF